MTSIDRADWHYGGDYPDDLPSENAATHIGMYLAWIISRDLGSHQLRTLEDDWYDRVRRREATGRALLMAVLDEKLFDELLDEEARHFTGDYYGAEGYFTDYDRVLGDSLPSLYHVGDTWENFDRLAPVLDERFGAWRRNRPTNGPAAR